jgi:hypothetical protein
MTSKSFPVYIVCILIYGITACVPNESPSAYPATPTPEVYPTAAEFPVLEVNPTQIATIPPPVITVLQNGQQQVTLPVIGLTFSYLPQRVINARIEPDHVFLLFDISDKHTGLNINIGREDCPQFDPLFTPGPDDDLMVPIDLNGTPALRRPVQDSIWVVFVYVERVNSCVIISAIAGKGDGEVIHEDSVRQQTLKWFDEILGTFQFTP